MARMAARKEAQGWFTGFFDQDYIRLLADQKPNASTRAEVAFLCRALQLERGARVLDVPCGYGRHAGLLAKRGLDVQAVDLSPALIAEARRRWADQPRLQFARGDLRRLAFNAEFDAVINLFNGFGFFSHRENERVLSRLGQALIPGGRLLIDQRDPEADARRPSWQRWWQSSDGAWVMWDYRFTASSGQCRLREVVVRPGRVRVRQKEARAILYRLPEWRAMALRAGMRVIAAYSDLGGTRYRPAAGDRLVVVAERR